MNPRRRRWNDRQVEALLRGRAALADDPSPDTDLLSVLADLRAFATTATPPPSLELAAILNGVVAVPASEPIPVLARQVNPRRNRIGAVAVLVTASLSVGTLATAANALPTGAQRAAATVLNTVTPFHFPKPQPAQPVHTPDPALSPSQDPSPSPETSGGEAGTTNPTAPTAGPESDGEHKGSPSPQEDPTDAPGHDGERGGTTSTGRTDSTGDTTTRTEPHRSQPSASPEPADGNADPSTGHAGTRPTASPTPSSQSDDQADSSSSG